MNLPFFNADREDTLQRCTDYLTQKQITDIINDILESIKYIDYNMNINLLVENIFTRIAMLNSPESQQTLTPICRKVMKWMKNGTD